MRAQGDRQIEMDHRTACQLLNPYQIALERDRVPQRDPRECSTTGSGNNVDGTSVDTKGSAGNMDGIANVLGIGRETGTENDGAG